MVSFFSKTRRFLGKLLKKTSMDVFIEHLFHGAGVLLYS